MRAYRTASVAFFLAALSACGGGNDGGGPEIRPSLTVSSLSISPTTAMLKIKGTETFTAMASMSNGSTSTVTPAWRSGNPAVATIDANGRATAVASGRTTITAEYQGVPAARDLRVVPDYHGTWSGRVNALTCTDDGDWHTGDFCKELGTGDVDSITLTASQQGALLSGTLDVGGFAGSITGSVAGDGTLTVTGDYTSPVLGYPVKIGIAEWQSVTTDNARMTGRFVFTVRADMMTGMARVHVALLNMDKASSAALAGMRSGEGRLIATMRAAARRH